jgi:hypothetical protein
VPNGIDFEQFRPEHAPATAARVVFCGVLNYQPSEEAALRLVRGIWPKVRAERQDARLLIVGAHPTARLRQAAEGDPSIEVTGAVPDVRPYLWSAAVSIAPLLTAQGLQNRVLGALAAGLPVVTTPAVADGLPDSAMPGCIVASDDQESADAVLALPRRTPTERRAFARHADLSELGWGRQLCRPGSRPDRRSAAEAVHQTRVVTRGHAAGVAARRFTSTTDKQAIHADPGSGDRGWRRIRLNRSASELSWTCSKAILPALSLKSVARVTTDVEINPEDFSLWPGLTTGAAFDSRQPDSISH